MLLDVVFLIIVAIAFFAFLNSVWFKLFLRVQVGRNRRRTAKIIPIDAYPARHGSSIANRRG